MIETKKELAIGTLPSAPHVLSRIVKTTDSPVSSSHSYITEERKKSIKKLLHTLKTPQLELWLDLTGTYNDS